MIFPVHGSGVKNFEHGFWGRPTSTGPYPAVTWAVPFLPGGPDQVRSFQFRMIELQDSCVSASRCVALRCVANDVTRHHSYASRRGVQGT